MDVLKMIYEKDKKVFFYYDLYNIVMPIVTFNNKYSFDECYEMIKNENFEKYIKEGEGEKILGNLIFHLEQYEKNINKIMENLDKINSYALMVLARYLNDEKIAKYLAERDGDSIPALFVASMLPLHSFSQFNKYNDEEFEGMLVKRLFPVSGVSIQ